MNIVKTIAEDNLPTHIKENTDFLRQKPQELLIAEVNCEGCRRYDMQRPGTTSKSRFFLKKYLR